MIRRCVRFGNRAVFSAGRVPIGSCPQVARGLGAWRFGACRDYTFRFRNRSKNDIPFDASFSSKTLVQSQSQHAQGSLPFSCRQLRRECASFTLTSSKYFSQYGRSSSSGWSQKQHSTQVAMPFWSNRACCMSCRYSSPAIDPFPSVF